MPRTGWRTHLAQACMAAIAGTPHIQSMEAPATYPIRLMRFGDGPRNPPRVAKRANGLARGLICAAMANAILAGVAAAEDGLAPAVADLNVSAISGAFSVPPIDAATGLPRTALLEEIAAWVSSRYKIPRPDVLPRIAFASSKKMIVIRSRAVPGDARTASAQSGSDPEIVSIYDTVDRIIYLPDGWSGATPAEMSVLVHEMVHHMQTVAKLTYACPEALEEAAFAAQAGWLAMYGSDLEAEFGIDPFTLLVRTNCPL